MYVCTLPIPPPPFPYSPLWDEYIWLAKGQLNPENALRGQAAGQLV